MLIPLDYNIIFTIQASKDLEELENNKGLGSVNISKKI
ncbi:MAG: hypothetical protein PG979_001416 [Rickettsia asembonensis]|nr:MAG: hypothetical protein PG979_001416 [Rickettsia asembonensis]